MGGRRRRRLRLSDGTLETATEGLRDSGTCEIVDFSRKDQK